MCHDLCGDWRLEQSFTPVATPTGNAITERVILTMKTELIWARDWESAQELREALETWRLIYNHRRPHESHVPHISQAFSPNLSAASVRTCGDLMFDEPDGFALPAAQEGLELSLVS